MWQGDGRCDDINNIEICKFDGGDCCGNNVDKSFCKKCECKEGNEFPYITFDLFFTFLFHTQISLHKRMNTLMPCVMLPCLPMVNVIQRIIRQNVGLMAEIVFQFKVLKIKVKLA